MTVTATLASSVDDTAGRLEGSTVPIKYLFKRTKTPGAGSEELLSLYRDHGVVPKRSRDDNHNRASEDLSNYQIVKPGYLVVNKMKAWQGSVAISAYQGIVSPAYFVYRPLSGVPTRYLHYVLRSDQYRQAFAAISSGVRPNQWDLDPDAFERLPVAIPLVSRSRAIADYLDHEIAEIDAFIADLQRMTALSQEEWRARRDAALSIGLSDEETATVSSAWFSQRAAHWQEGPLKFLFDISLGKMLDEGRQVAEAEQYPYVRAGDVGDGKLNLENLNRMPFDDREQRKFTLNTGDLLVVEGGSVGTNVVLDRPLDGIYFQKTVNRMRPKGSAVPRFYSEVLNAYRESGVLDTVCNRSTIMHLTADKLGNLVVPVPPVDEQRSIATYLQATRRQVEELVDECKHAINLADERRAALISAAVTGQIDVTQRHKPVAEQLEEEVLQNA